MFWDPTVIIAVAVPDCVEPQEPPQSEESTMSYLSDVWLGDIVQGVGLHGLLTVVFQTKLLIGITRHQVVNFLV